MLCAHDARTGTTNAFVSTRGAQGAGGSAHAATPPCDPHVTAAADARAATPTAATGQPACASSCVARLHTCPQCALLAISYRNVPSSRCAASTEMRPSLRQPPCVPLSARRLFVPGGRGRPPYENSERPSCTAPESAHTVARGARGPPSIRGADTTSRAQRAEVEPRREIAPWPRAPFTSPG